MERHRHFGQVLVTHVTPETDCLSGKTSHPCLQRGLRAFCDTFPPPIVSAAWADRTSIDLLQSYDNWAIKTSERHPARSLTETLG